MSNAIWPSEPRQVERAQTPANGCRPNAGVLQLVLRRTGTRTVIADCYSHVPLQVLRPVYLDDNGTAYVYLLNPGGGVVGGDTYTMQITLEAAARAYLTTPSATRLYAAPETPAQQHIDITLDAGAVLTYLPEQTIPFAEAAFHQYLDIRLGPGAGIFLGDIVAPGRLARGEMFAYREYCSRIRLTDAHGAVLLVDHCRLQPQHHNLAALGRLEGYAYLGTFYAVCQGTMLPSALVEPLQALLAEQRSLTGSVTLLAHGGVAARLLGADYSSMNQALFDLWRPLYQHLYGGTAVPHRT
jgi:urease accessory protein